MHGPGIRRAEIADQLVPSVIPVSHPAGAAPRALFGLPVAAAATAKAVVNGSNSGQGLRKVRHSARRRTS